MTQHKISSTKILGLGVALILVMISFLAWMPFAHADSNSTVVDKNATGSITVHSLEGGTINDKPTGDSDSSVSSATKVNGASFKLTKQSGIDVTTIKGMQDAAKVTVDSFNPDSSFGTSGAMTGTTVNGEYKFSGLKPGVYLLEQTSAPKGYQKAIKSIIVLPLTKPTGDGFIYDIHVYPKNAKIGKITKTNTTTKGALLKEGSEMTFQIKVPIPAKDSKNPYTEFSVTDTPVSGLELKENSVTSVSLNSQDMNGKYTVSVVDSNAVKLTLSDSGLQELNNLTSEANLIVNVKGTVKDIANAGTVKNKASYAFKRKDGTVGGGETGDDDNPDSSLKFGFIKIKNVQAGTDQEVNGAKFKIGKCTADGKAVETSAVLTSNVSSGNVSEAIGAMESPAKLCVQQTTPPTDYALNPEANAVQFDQATIANVTKTNPLEVKIENTKANDFLKHLPLTGGSGVIGFLAGGIVLLIVAVALMARKRHQN